MAKPFDATLKELLERYPSDWLAQLGMTAAGTVELIDADLSTITTQSDKLIRVNDPDPWLLHIELQAGRDPRVDRRALKYNVLAFDRHDLPVESVVVLLRPEADAPNLTGRLAYRPARGKGSLEFQYQLLRLWQRPVETVLAGGVGTLPLAPLCAVSQEAVPEVIDQMRERFQRDASPPEAAILWTSTYILMGLRFPPRVVAQMLRGVRDMEESATYQAILAEGEKRLLLLMGTKRFGPPDAPTRAAIDELDSPKRLEQLSERLLEVASWEELLTAS